MQLAQSLAKSQLIPKALRGKPEDILVTILSGHELGLSPMQSLRGIYVIDGKPCMYADLIVGLVKRSPACKYFQLTESTTERATYTTHREGEPEPTSMTYTLDDATKAGLLRNQTWKSHPAAMLRARCSAALSRAVYPDVAQGLYEFGEGAEMSEGALTCVPEESAPFVCPSTFTTVDYVRDVVEADEIDKLIAAATTTEELEALRPRIRELPTAQQDERKQKFFARAGELRK